MYKKLLCFSFVLFSCSKVADFSNLDTIKDYYYKGVEYSSQKEYTKAIQTFKKGLSIGDPVEDEYYVSMSEYEIAFNLMLQNRNKEALDYINKILSQLISSKKPRILAEQLRQKIYSGTEFKNASY